MEKGHQRNGVVTVTWDDVIATERLIGAECIKLISTISSKVVCSIGDVRARITV